MKPVKIILISVLTALLIVGGLSVKIIADKRAEAQYNQYVASIARDANDIVSDVEKVLQSTAPTSWVYDADGNLIMTLKLSDGFEAAKTLPEYVSQEIVRRSDGDVYSLVVREFLQLHSKFDEATFDGYTRRLRDDFTQDELVRYLASGSPYGDECFGIVEAANHYFGCGQDELNEAQLQFLMYLYRNTAVDMNQYFIDHNTDAAGLGLLSSKGDYSALRGIVISELKNIPTVKVEEASYIIRLSLSGQQQALIQTAINFDMRPLFDLNSDGSFVMDCSAIVLDRNTGFIRAYVPGRSSTVKHARAFSLGATTFEDNFKELADELKQTTTYGFSLREVKRANGDVELKSVRQLFESLALVRGEAKNSSLLSVVKAIYPESSLGVIQQITTAEGVSVYSSSGKARMDFNNPRLCSYFSEDPENQTKIGLRLQIPTGIVAYCSTGDYIVVALAGTGDNNTTVLEECWGVLSSTVESVMTNAANFYPTPTVRLWSEESLVQDKLLAYQANQTYVEELYNDMLADLKSIDINSSESRKRFEDSFENINRFIMEYRGFVGDSYADILSAKLQNVRLERTPLLLKYSV